MLEASHLHFEWYASTSSDDDEIATPSPVTIVHVHTFGKIKGEGEESESILSGRRVVWESVRSVLRRGGIGRAWGRLESESAQLEHVYHVAYGQDGVTNLASVARSPDEN